MMLAARYIKKKAERKKTRKNEKNPGNTIPPFKLQISIWEDKPQKPGS